ncbi:MAG: histidine kinase [Bacteroidota bacterium]
MEEWTLGKKYPLHQHILFWLAVYACYCIANIEDHLSWSELFVTYAFKVSVQAAIAYYLLLLVLPTYFAHRHTLRLVSSILLLLIVLQVVAESWRYFYLEQAYPVTYSNCINRYRNIAYSERLFNGITIFFRNPAIYLPPAVGLMALQYVQKQRSLAEFKEQKKTNELKALKNQMNPHFLFNTLNNLYTLALKKSDKTPEVIARLSEILDYMLYRCNDELVPIQREIELLENYLELEKIRYGERVQIQFDRQVQHPIQIAPLMLLHFVENAFKHGVRQELSQASIHIQLHTTANTIDFCIENSIANGTANTFASTEGIGLQNIRRQLLLLYPQRHQIDFRRTTSHFRVQLKIHTA